MRMRPVMPYGAGGMLRSFAELSPIGIWSEVLSFALVIS
jgi:hypothetical protein